MSTNPNQDQRSDPRDIYGGYTGYKAASSADDPYRNHRQNDAQQSDPNYVYGQQRQGQQHSYEPPESVRKRQGKRGSESSSSFASIASRVSSGSIEKEDRKFALYSYLGFCFTGIVFFFLKRKRPFVRFHAAQSIILFLPIAAILAVLKIASLVTLIPFIGWILIPVFSLLFFIIVVPTILLWIALMVLSYQGIRVKLPIVGHYAEALTARFSAEKTRTV